ncbi:MAG: zinc-binding dehydrogenase, partial [Paracoccaceae bacterium]|nr:zinc-binding dehydrogenase [Paracoccaceae bacterium]
HSGVNPSDVKARAGSRPGVTAPPFPVIVPHSAGADTVLDYRDPDLAAKVLELTEGRGVDRAVEVEFGRNAAMLAQAVAENGSIAAYGSAQEMNPVLPFGAYLFRAITIDVVLIYLLPEAQRSTAIGLLHRAHAAGALRPAIHAHFALPDCAAAHRAVEAGRRSGAVLLDIG